MANEQAPVWSASLVKVRREKWIAVRIPPEARLIARIKQFNGAKWDAGLRSWLLPDTPDHRRAFKLTAEVQLSSQHLHQIETFTSWLRSKRYSNNTVKVYTD